MNYDDIVIGAYHADSHSDAVSGGVTYIAFGNERSAFDDGNDVNDLNGTNGFRLLGDNVNDYSGYSVSTLGDINGDGYDDIIVGKPERYGETPHAYVYFGKAGGYTADVQLENLNGHDGFALVGTGGDHHGFSVSEAGDVNGDGYDDMLIGAPQVPNIVFSLTETDGPGETWLVYGKKSGYKASVALNSLDDTEGFRIAGIDNKDKSGFSASSAGDINNDGYADIIIGAPGAASGKGESYVIFGGDFTGDSTISSGSSDDLLRDSGSLSRSLSESRDNPLTPGDVTEPVFASTSEQQLCLGYQVMDESSNRGNASDLIATGEATDLSTDEEENAN